MNWLLIALISPLLWTISTYIDKLLISRYFKGGAGVLIIYSCFIGLPVALLIALFKPLVLSIPLSTGILLSALGFVYISYLFPYLRALNSNDTSLVTPLFQIVPVFSFILAYFFLGERLTSLQIFAGSLIILGAIGISLRFSGKKMFLHREVFFLMLLACFIISLNYLFFKFFALELSFWIVSFWQYLGMFVFGLVLLVFVKKYRIDFFSSFKNNRYKIILLNVVNEVINIVAVIIFSFASLLAPLALVSVVNSIQPLFTLLLGLALSIFFPDIIKENLEKKTIIIKILCIIVMFIGAYYLNLF